MDAYDLMRIALRYDTLMSWALLKALRITREQARGIVRTPRDGCDGVRECFENRTHVRIGYGGL